MSKIKDILSKSFGYYINMMKKVLKPVVSIGKKYNHILFFASISFISIILVIWGAYLAVNLNSPNNTLGGDDGDDLETVSLFDKFRLNVKAADVEIVPTKGDKLAVDPDSEFLLKTTKELDIVLIKDSLTIEPELEYDIAKVDNNEYKITFKEILEPNSVVNFKIASKSEGTNKDLTWGFSSC